MKVPCRHFRTSWSSQKLLYGYVKKFRTKHSALVVSPSVQCSATYQISFRTQKAGHQCSRTWFQVLSACLLFKRSPPLHNIENRKFHLAQKREAVSLADLILAASQATKPTGQNQKLSTAWSTRVGIVSKIRARNPKTRQGFGKSKTCRFHF